MKNQLMSFVSVSLRSKFFKAAMVVALVAGASNYVSAQAVPTSNVIASNEPGLSAVVSHVGNTADVMVFSVRVPNTKGEKFTIQIKDIDGNTVFNNSFTEKNFARKFQLPKSESDKFTFQIKDASGIVAQTFEVDAHVRFVEEVVVKKII